ncbi:hypothetical protein F2P81_010784 [Scophthalmus maximus]|uniref:Uncharacterized protein n=1 Tax=Scophthalmus maximus TaxID=52904 RepID=A0A6A4T1K6_SCOMX|nr:hypothetical protein F2P81_010784 [Scophthalmus maximus]
MDSVDSSKVQNALRAQGQKLQQFEEVLSTMQQEMRIMAKRQLGLQQAVGEQVSHLTTQFQALQSPAASPVSQSSTDPGSSAGSTVGGGPAVSLVQSSVSSTAQPHLSRPERFSVHNLIYGYSRDSGYSINWSKSEILPPNNFDRVAEVGDFTNSIH